MQLLLKLSVTSFDKCPMFYIFYITLLFKYTVFRLIKGYRFAMFENP